jgi:iron complex outermembrane receptor protein
MAVTPAHAEPRTAAPGTSAPSEPDADPADDIVVTGTRQTGVRAADSAAPVQVLNAEALSRVGQPNLNQVLTQLAPSFTAQAFGGDASNLTLTAKLRGLSANHVLVLVNGKRRHGTANLHVTNGPFQGGAAPDLDLIPPEAIERIEILQDGAAAQYGSDAIAGVINIILKSDRSGGSASATAGQYYAGDGDTAAASVRLAVPIGEDGFLDVTGFHRFHDFSQRAGADRRLVAPDGTPLAGLPAAWQTIPGYPRVNPIIGDARSSLTTGFVNAGYDFGTVEAYAFGSYSRRIARANEQYRLPSRVSRTVAGVVVRPFPNGFVPQLGLEEDDYSFTGGLRGEAGAWSWDLSTTYGRDTARLSTLNSANASLYADTGFTPRDFDDGRFTASQFTANLDLRRELDLGLSAPATLAFGAEYRRDRYAIGAGDAASTYKEGGQSFPGFQRTDAGDYTRDAWSLYGNVVLRPVAALTVDLAGRYENYQGIGDTLIGKLTTRYDLSPAFAVRGTVSTGFRAPTLAESYYSATNVSPTSAVIQLPANSAAATIVGFSPLRSERSTSLSGGVVLRPADALTITLDAYQISVRDRIAGSGTILGKSGTTVVNQQVLDAIAARGNVVDPTATFVGVSAFTNGVDTRTQGIELAATYPLETGLAKLEWSLTANYNRTRITRNRLGDALFNAVARSNLETASPRFKGILSVLATRGALSANLRETLYGSSRAFVSPSGAAPFYEAKVGTALLTDLELTWATSLGVDLSIGANNLFDRRPETAGLVPGSTTTATAGPVTIGGAQVYDAPFTFSPYGINGGYYYARVTARF